MIEEDINIKSFDPEKNKVTQLIKMFNLFVSNKKKGHIHDTLTFSGNPLIKTLHKILMETLPKISDEHPVIKDRYRKMIQNPIEFFLYIYYTDSAYRDIGNFMIWRLKQEFKNNPSLEKHLDDEVKKPSNWYFNNWSDFMLETKNKQESGELTEGLLCDSEQLMVDEQQKNVIEGLIKKNVEGKKRFEHW